MSLEDTVKADITLEQAFKNSKQYHRNDFLPGFANHMYKLAMILIKMSEMHKVLMLHSITNQILKSCVSIVV